MDMKASFMRFHYLNKLKIKSEKRQKKTNSSDVFASERLSINNLNFISQKYFIYTRVEVPEIFSAEQRCFRDLMFFSGVQRWFRKLEKHQR